MLQEPDGVFEMTDRDRTMSVRGLADADRRVHLCLAGEIDMAATAALHSTVDWLATLTPVSVEMDLSKLSFAGATLPNFIVRIRQALPTAVEIVLCRSQPEVHWVLQVTGMANVTTMRDESEGYR